jgi:hypothetical protein
LIIWPDRFHGYNTWHVNLRFPEIFGAIVFGCVACSFGLPQSYSGRIETSLQAVFSPLAGPIQWMVGRSQDELVKRDTPLLSEITDEVARLREEKQHLLRYSETLIGQLATLRRREADAERVGERLRDLVKTIKVISPDAGGRDILRLAGTDMGLEPGQAVIAPDIGLVGVIKSVGVGDQSSVQLITDKGFKLIGQFIRPEPDASGNIQITTLSLAPTIVEGRGRSEMEITSLKMEDVKAAGLRDGDAVVLADSGPSWPIEVHGQRVGVVTKVEENPLVPGIATIRVRPEYDLLALREVSVIFRPEMMPAK